jgi:aspartyl-tRNA(Asn)/glutamyl-tRNA(Gln) amidotransferase subunit C
MVAFAVPPAFTRDDAAAIAALANLELTPEELDHFAKQLGDILAYAAEVQRIDTTGVAPTASIIPRHPADRPDVTAASIDRDLALANAPDASADAGMFRVPRVLR